MVTSKSSAAQSATETKSAKGPRPLTQQSFAQAYAEWIRQQQESALNYQQRCGEAYFKLINNLNEIAAAAHRPINDAQVKLMVASQTANLDEESWQNFQQQQEEFGKLMRAHGNDTSFQESIQKAYREYAEATQKALEEAHAHNLKAYQKYLKVVKDGWTQIDVEKLNAADLRAIEWSTKVAFQAPTQ